MKPLSTEWGTQGSPSVSLSLPQYLVSHSTPSPPALYLCLSLPASTFCLETGVCGLHFVFSPMSTYNRRLNTQLLNLWRSDRKSLKPAGMGSQFLQGRGQCVLQLGCMLTLLTHLCRVSLPHTTTPALSPPAPPLLGPRGHWS